MIKKTGKSKSKLNIDVPTLEYIKQRREIEKQIIKEEKETAKELLKQEKEKAKLEKQKQRELLKQEKEKAKLEKQKQEDEELNKQYTPSELKQMSKKLVQIIDEMQILKTEVAERLKPLQQEHKKLSKILKMNENKL